MECLLDHIALNVEDDDRMLVFYTEVLELPSERLTAYRAGKVPFASVRLNANTIIDLFPKTLWAKQPGQQRGLLNHLCMALSKSQWQALHERLLEHQVAIETGPVPRWGAHGQGTSLYFRDPEGTLLEARYYESMAQERECLLGS